MIDEMFRNSGVNEEGGVGNVESALTKQLDFNFWQKNRRWLPASGKHPYK